MARDSDEFGTHLGLGWLDASVRRIEPKDPSLRVPHVGWNEVRQSSPHPIFEGIPDRSLFYFVHSYHIRLDTRDALVGECDYGTPLTAAFARDNIVGTQFHPEKSQRHGLQLLRNFLTR
jgi:glutamine amidotransferase